MHTAECDAIEIDFVEPFAAPNPDVIRLAWLCDYRCEGDQRIAVICRCSTGAYTIAWDRPVPWPQVYLPSLYMAEVYCELKAPEYVALHID